MPNFLTESAETYLAAARDAIVQDPEISHALPINRISEGGALEAAEGSDVRDCHVLGKLVVESGGTVYGCIIGPGVEMRVGKDCRVHCVDAMAGRISVTGGATVSGVRIEGPAGPGTALDLDGTAMVGCTIFLRKNVPTRIGASLFLNNMLFGPVVFGSGGIVCSIEFKDRALVQFGDRCHLMYGTAISRMKERMQTFLDPAPRSNLVTDAKQITGDSRLRGDHISIQVCAQTTFGDDAVIQASISLNVSKPSRFGRRFRLTTDGSDARLMNLQAEEVRVGDDVTWQFVPSKPGRPVDDLGTLTVGDGVCVLQCSVSAIIGAGGISSVPGEHLIL